MQPTSVVVCREVASSYSVELRKQGDIVILLIPISNVHLIFISQIKPTFFTFFIISYIIILSVYALRRTRAM